MSTFEQFLAVKNLGVAVGVSDPAVLVAARESDGTRGPVRLKAMSHELLVSDADAASGLADIVTALGNLLTGIVLAAGTNLIGKVSPADDQDPIFDTANGVLRSGVTTNTLLITPPAGCKYVRVSSDADCYVNTADGAAADDGGSIRIIANSPEIIPVTAGTDVNVFASSAANVRAMPLKAR